ncbi:MAG: OmpA family protein [Candidatus Adiutrix sp.]|jgi:chemotaxis protein MotB|nr:OmpA family protein [Candidatus Adiutrix sp.]
MSDADLFDRPGPAETGRRKARQKRESAPQSSWLTTFADLVTLLLTFLVLLISVTTLEPRLDFSLAEGALEESDVIDPGNGALLYADTGLTALVLELVDRLPEEVMFDPREIKDAIFQLDPAKTPDYEQVLEAAEEGVKIFQDRRGLVIQWDRSLLFPEGGTSLYEANLPLMQKMAAFLRNVKLPLSLEGHSNPLSGLEGGDGPAGYDLSMRRAKVFMEYLVAQGVPENRFRLGGHGGSRPRTLDPDQAWENSRLELIIYQPDQSSWIGR